MNRRSLIFGLLCSPVGLGVAGYVTYNAGTIYDAFPLHAGAAALITSTLLWRLIVEKLRRHGVLAGALVGAVSGLLSHYLCWYFELVEINIRHWIFDDAVRHVSSFVVKPIGLLKGLWASWIFAYWSWLFWGWLTAPAGGIIGGLYAWYLGRKSSANAAGPHQ